jgi:hypothetical protein
MQHLVQPDVLIAIRCFMALVFMTAAIGKLRHGSEFAGVLANYRLLPAALVTPLATAIPPFEVVLSVALVADARSALPIVTAMTLLALFGAAMAINLARGRRDIDCGCFQNHLKQTLRWALVARNAIMIALLGVALSPGRGAPLWVAANAVPIANGVLAGTAAFLILQSLNTLWAIVPASPRRVATATAARAP